MSAAEVLAELRALQFEVRANGDRLRLNGPAHALTLELRARVLAAKPELLQLLAAPLLDHGLAVREVLTFPAAFLGELPLPTTLALDVPGVAGPVTAGTHPGSQPATFSAAEWLAMVLAAETERANAGHLAAWCERKRRVPRWQLTAADAYGAVFDARSPRWTVDRVLRQLGATLRMVVIDSGA